MRAACLIVLIAVLAAAPAPAGAQRPRGVPFVIDPVTKRIHKYCGNRPKCIAAQHRGIKAFLIEVTKHPRPSRERVQRCTRQATSKNLTDWTKAARCLR